MCLGTGCAPVSVTTVPHHESSMPVAWRDVVARHYAADGVIELEGQLFRRVDLEGGGGGEGGVRRFLLSDAAASDERIPFGTKLWFTYALCALCCVVAAAFAAGLTMGLVAIDPVHLRIILLQVRVCVCVCARRQGGLGSTPLTALAWPIPSRTRRTASRTRSAGHS